MSGSRKNKWVAFWFFLPSSLAMAYFVFYLASHAPAHAADDHLAEAETRTVHAETNTKVILSKGRTTTLGKMKLTYQGLKDDCIVLDVTLLDLDPGYAYHRNIPVNAAEQGFWLAAKYFKVVSAGRSVLKIIRVQS